MIPLNISPLFILDKTKYNDGSIVVIKWCILTRQIIINTKLFTYKSHIKYEIDFLYPLDFIYFSQYKSSNLSLFTNGFFVIGKEYQHFH